MKLIEIKGLIDMEGGSPSPTILSNDNHLFLIFYANYDDIYQVPESGNYPIFSLKFIRSIKYSFGSPGNETLDGHPYSALGLSSYAFYELEQSDLIESLIEINKAHPYATNTGWNDFKHYIITFHDNMFECIATGFEITKDSVSIYEQASMLLKKLSS